MGGTSQLCQAPSTQACSPGPQASEQARVTLGVSQACHKPALHNSTPLPQPVVHGRSAPSVRHVSGSNWVREPQAESSSAKVRAELLPANIRRFTRGLLLRRADRASLIATASDQ